MKSISCLAVAVLVLASAGCGDDEETDVLLATTTSTVDSGLLEELIPLFEEDSDYNIQPLSLGSGQALETAANGDADLVLVHSPAAEEEFIAEGNGIERRLVMHNAFVIVGPADDPAGVADAGSAAEVFARIAERGGDFVSRGDDSGTHNLELKIWDEAGIDPTAENWYSETGQGMGATLIIAEQRLAYTVVDRGTLLSFATELALEALFEGDPILLNIYHVILVNPGNHDDLDEEGAEAFADFLLSEDAQRVIDEFGVEEFGQQLFVADAGKTIEEVEQGE